MLDKKTHQSKNRIFLSVEQNNRILLFNGQKNIAHTHVFRKRKVTWSKTNTNKKKSDVVKDQYKHTLSLSVFLSLTVTFCIDKFCIDKKSGLTIVCHLNFTQVSYFSRQPPHNAYTLSTPVSAHSTRILVVCLFSGEAEYGGRLCHSSNRHGKAPHPRQHGAPSAPNTIVLRQ
jgi:hypothetical protein